jgi:hypothetical protein
MSWQQDSLGSQLMPAQINGKRHYDNDQDHKAYKQIRTPPVGVAVVGILAHKVEAPYPTTK